jgi:hypothetical protein
VELVRLNKEINFRKAEIKAKEEEAALKALKKK